MKYLLLLLLLIPSLCFGQGTITLGSGGTATLGSGGTATTYSSSGKSMKFTHDQANHGAGYVYYTHSSSLKEFWAEYWIRFSEVNSWGALGDYYSLNVRTSTDGTNVIVDHMSNVGGTDVTVLKTSVYDDTSAENASSNTADHTAGTWHQVRIHWKAATGDGNNDGIMAVYFDNMDTPIRNTTNLNNDLYNAKVFRLGLVGTADIDSSTLVIYIDDFKLGTTAGASEILSVGWNSASTPEDGWTGKTDTGTALSIDTGVYH